MYDTLDNQRQQEEEEDLAIGAVDDPEYESFSYTGNLHQNNDIIYETSKYRKIKMPNDALSGNYILGRWVINARSLTDYQAL